MAKTPDKRLFNLIKSMSSSEKRYFKLFAGRRESGNVKYLDLFDAINLQEEFNEDALILATYGKEPIKSRKYSELKSYLFDLIIKSLEQFDEQKSAFNTLNRRMNSIQVLFKRGLYKECHYLLKQAEKLARKYEYFSHILTILDWKKKIAHATMDKLFFERELPQIAAMEAEVLAQEKNLSLYRNLFFKALINIKREAVLRSKAGKKAFAELEAHPLLQSPEKALSRKARIAFYRTYSILKYAELDLPAFYEASKTLVHMIEENPYLLREETSEYISALSNFTLSCGLSGKYDEVELGLKKLKRVKPSTLDDQIKIHRQYYSNKFSLCIFTGEFEEGLKALNEHEKEMPGFGRKLFEKGEFYHHYFYIHFGNNQFEEALHYLNLFLSLPRSVSRREDLKHIARMLNLITHFEMGNELLLQYLLRSTYRYLKTKNRLHIVEEGLLASLRKLNRIDAKKDDRTILAELKVIFESLAKIPSEKMIFQYFDFIAWLDSKIQNRPFRDVVKEKYGRNANV